MNRWSGSLGELVELQRGITYKSNLLGQPGPVLLGLASIQRNGGFRSDSLQTYGGDSPEKLILRAGDIYVSLKDVTQAGDLVGAVSRVPEELVGRLTQDTVKLNFKRKDVSQNFIYWLLRTPQYRAYCRALAIGTTNLSLRREDFLALPVSRPSASELSLVELFEAIEKKIELNLEMNRTLERIAQATFKHWFVDFQFPGFDGELVDGLPKNWKGGKIADFGRIVCGKTPSKTVSEYFGGNVPFIKIPDMHNTTFVIETNDSLTEAGARSQSNKMIPAYSICVSSIATVGLVCLNPMPCQTNQQINSIVPNEMFYTYYLYLLASSMKDIFLSTSSGGTATLNMNTTRFSNLEAVLPDKSVLSDFHLILSPVFDRILHNLYEVKTLSQIRDNLLPKLMSGKIRVPE